MTAWCEVADESVTESMAADAAMAQFVVRSSRSRQAIMRDISPR
jgi:hypothetical protein